MAAETGARSYYLDDYSDETVPCDCTLEGWAAWLATDALDWPHQAPNNGEAFTGSATLWRDDVIATFDGEAWQLSRDIDGSFAAVRFGPEMGWDADSICGDSDSVRDYLGESGPSAAGDVEYIAVGEHEEGWRFTYHAGPPARLSAERVQ